MRKFLSSEQRFYPKVKPVESGCHEWTAHIMPNGYGQFRHKGKAQYAHRVAYELANGPFDSGLYVLHSCDNRKCVNPAHLSLGTFNENMADMVQKLRQAHGDRNGHAKLSIEQVKEIRSAVGTHREISQRYSVTQGLISMIRSGRIWKHV